MGLAYSHLIGVATASHLDLVCELPVNALLFRIHTVLFELQFAQLGVELANVTLDEDIFSKCKNNNNYASRFAIIWLINWNSMKVTTRHKRQVVPLVEWPMDPQNDCETGIGAKYMRNSQWMYMWPVYAGFIYIHIPAHKEFTHNAQLPMHLCIMRIYYIYIYVYIFTCTHIRDVSFQTFSVIEAPICHMSRPACQSLPWVAFERTAENISPRTTLKFSYKRQTKSTTFADLCTNFC